MAGRLVLVVGPSGAGKDTLLAAAKTALAGDARYVFPKRIITRQAMAEAEDHDSVSPERFAELKAGGAFALDWDAHGLSYGLPASLRDDLAADRTVVFNGSRAAVAEARRRFEALTVVLIEATPEVRAARLAGRGRESAAEIAERLRRDVSDPLPGAVRVDNSGPLADGVAAFLAALATTAADA
jgi:ribose 1,5-bisphosphokinase